MDDNKVNQSISRDFNESTLISEFCFDLTFKICSIFNAF